MTDFLEQLPRDMLFVFRTNNMVRALNKDLGGSSRCVLSLVASPLAERLADRVPRVCVRSDRFAVMGKYAVEGHAALYSERESDGSLVSRVWGSYCYWRDHFTMRFHLNVIDAAMGLVQRVSGGKPLKMKTAG